MGNRRVVNERPNAPPARAVHERRDTRCVSRADVGALGGSQLTSDR
jgi:hypothetical protein